MARLRHGLHCVHSAGATADAVPQAEQIPQRLWLSRGCLRVQVTVYKCRDIRALQDKTSPETDRNEAVTVLGVEKMLPTHEKGIIDAVVKEIMV